MAPVPSITPLPVGWTAYPSPEVKWAKHPKKKCLSCRTMLQGRYYALDAYTWTCMRCGADVLKSGGRLVP